MRRANFVAVRAFSLFKSRRLTYHLETNRSSMLAARSLPLGYSAHSPLATQGGVSFFEISFLVRPEPGERANFPGTGPGKSRPPEINQPFGADRRVRGFRAARGRSLGSCYSGLSRARPDLTARTFEPPFALRRKPPGKANPVPRPPVVITRPARLGGSCFLGQISLDISPACPDAAKQSRTGALAPEPSTEPPSWRALAFRAKRTLRQSPRRAQHNFDIALPLCS